MKCQTQAKREEYSEVLNQQENQPRQEKMERREDAQGRKKCSSCKKYKPLLEFYKNREKRRARCKKCDYVKYHKINNPIRWGMRSEEYKQSLYSESRRHVLLNPWLRSYYSARERVSKNCGSKLYRNLCFNISKSDIKFLWFRDLAYNMKIPSIDRIDNSIGYTLENCRFVESRENAATTTMHRNNREMKIQGLKKCPQCDEVNPLNFFGKRKMVDFYGLQIYSSWCKRCVTLKARARKLKVQDHSVGLKEVKD
jgi:thiol-disulfide isomerase/thioredoxin